MYSTVQDTFIYVEYNKMPLGTPDRSTGLLIHVDTLGSRNTGHFKEVLCSCDMLTVF